MSSLLIAFLVSSQIDSDSEVERIVLALVLDCLLVI